MRVSERSATVPNSMKLQDLLPILDRIAPLRFAESWDNVGLLAGDPSQDVSRAMLCIDYTPEVACESAGEKCDLVIAYHPPLFDAIKRIVANGIGANIYDAIKRGVAIYSPHTALDVAEGGTNDLLADAIGISATDRGPLRSNQTKPTRLKLVTFVPEEHVQRVSDALFHAGAGRIGNYTQCSFRSPGTGTFLGGEGSNPTIGQSGKLEQAAEVRVETIVPMAKLAEIIKALRTSHPYEEPAFDLVQLAAPPETLGQGRLGTMPRTSRKAVIDRIKRELKLDHLLIAGSTEGDITKAACCAGSAGTLLEDAIAAGAQLYLTGELRHHDALKAAKAGMTVICTLHSNSERAVLNRLSERLRKEAPELRITVSQKDRDPFTII